MTDIDTHLELVPELDKQEAMQKPRPIIKGPSGILVDGPRIETVRGLTSLSAHKDAWRELAAASMAGNPCYLDFNVCGALGHVLEDAENVEFIIIWHDGPKPQRSEMIGFFPVRRQDKRWFWPVNFAHGWIHFFAFSGTPLIHKDYATMALDGFFSWARNRAKLKAFMFQNITGEGLQFDAMCAYLAQTDRKFSPFNVHERAIMHNTVSWEDYQLKTISGQRRRKYRRFRKRLGEQGRLESSFIEKAGPEEAAGLIEAFLTLEAEGWKGKQGSASLCREETAKGIRAAVIQAFAQDKCLYWQLKLDGRPIAICFGFHTPRKAWLFKMTYDEAFAKYSPGVLLMLDISGTIASSPDFDELDSCAIPNHPMYRHIWGERLLNADLMVEVDPQGTRFIFTLICLAERACRTALLRAKKLYYLITKKKRS